MGTKSRKELSFELAFERKKANINQQKMAEKIGITGCRLSSYETGKSKWSEMRLKMYCEILNVSFSKYKVLSEKLTCDVCGSSDIMEAPHMGKNCNNCHNL